MIEPFQNAYVLTGPTGSGKTELAVALAERLGAEIISMDSMAVYRGMDIVTAKPDAEARERVPHHLIDVLDPWESSSVAWWLEQAAECCRDIEKRGRKTLLVGGTPLYLKTVLRGLFPGPPADLQLRCRLEQEAEHAGLTSLHDRLMKVDPVSAGRLHPNDLRRIVRALEVWELTGQSISTWQTQWSEEASSAGPPVLCLELPREELYGRIDARVAEMFARGLLDEVHRLRGLSRPLGREAGQALGCTEVLGHLAGEASLEETIRKIQTRSRQFAKRQLTWFRHLSECRMARRELTFALWGLTMDNTRGKLKG